MAKVEKKICLKCKSEKRLGEFYKSNSELNSDGKLPWCKDCIQDRYNTLLTICDGKSISAFKHLLMNLDEFFSEQLYNECVIKDGTKFIGEYFKVVNRDKNYRENTSLNNTLESNETKDIQLEDGVISEDLILRWGRGRKKEDYILLEKRYNQKINDYPSKKPAEKSIIRSMCLLELDIEEARISDKKSVPSLEKALADKFKQLGINPSDNSMYDEQSMLKFGVIMGIIENDYPIVDSQERYKDVDNMHYYWYRNLIVPTMKAWDMADGDYSIDKGIDNIDVKPEIKALMEDYKDGK
ncbi:hypothetical protein [Terrisporobacter sp.]|uniref:hypothetical protein n=1 Tax=Terrisporobacter sp. TaxID=1965305 RepID=UPI0028978E07|nr:hypothetical protein [Terrisporobacter sp.]